MKNPLAFISLLLVLLPNISARAEKDPMTWFKNIDCSELNITKYKSAEDSTAVAEMKIVDKTALADLVKRIQALPSNGTEMIKMGPKAEHTRLEFKFSDKTQQSIEIYARRFKTPSTGFIAEKNPLEIMLTEDIENLIQPELNRRILKIKDQRIKFKDFTIAYKRTTHTPQPIGGPTIGPTNQALFSIFKNDSANETILSVFDGQLPPQPESFVAANKEYILLTFLSSKKKRLDPNYFEISNKLPKN